MKHPFVYADEPADVGIKGAHLAVVPAGLGDRDALFRALVLGLRLPSYFGANWDALDECLRDLSWIENHRVVLFHEALPELGQDGLSTYLQILRDAVLDWRSDEDDELVVGFAPGLRDAVSRLLAVDPA